MYRISKQFEFAASHVLEGLAPGHKCGRLHGHNYRIELVLESNDLDSTGFVEDYGGLADFRDYLASTLDHQHLNDALWNIGNPSAENLARHLYDIASKTHPFVAAVRVSETQATWAEYRP